MKKMKIINIIILIGMIGINLYYIGWNIIDGRFNKLIDCGILFLTLLIPFFVKKILKVELSELFKFIFYGYIIMTVLLGDVMELIKYTLWFDKIVHCYFGFLMSLVGVLLIYYKQKNLKKELFFNILFIIGFALLVANLHEFIEYGLDRFFGTNHQRYMQTDVNDTMQDLLVTFLAGIIVSVIYYIETKMNKNCFIFYSIRNDVALDIDMRNKEKVQD